MNSTEPGTEPDLAALDGPPLALWMLLALAYVPVWRQQMAIDNQGLIGHVVGTLGHLTWPLDRDEAFSAAQVGLLNAIDAWNPRRGEFSTCAYPWIKWAIVSAAVKERRARRRGGRSIPVGSLDKIENADKNPALAVEPCGAAVDARLDVRPAMERLRARHPRLHHVLLRHSEGWSARQIGRELGVTRQRANQLHRQAAKELRGILEGQG